MSSKSGLKTLKLELQNRLEEPKQEADKGNLDDKDAVWPNRHMENFSTEQVATLTDNKTISFMEPLFYVMGPGLRNLMFVTGFISESMDQRKLAENLRTLLVHYKNDMTSNDPRGRMIAETISNHLVNEWCRLCLLYTSPSPRDGLLSRMPSSA